MPRKAKNGFSPLENPFDSDQARGTVLAAACGLSASEEGQLQWSRRAAVIDEEKTVMAGISCTPTDRSQSARRKKY